MKNTTCIRLEANKEQIISCKQTLDNLEPSFTVLSNALSLAGNTVRLQILYLLATEKELCVCDLSDILNMKVAAISQHLRKLKDRNLIIPNRKAQTIFYQIAPEYHILFAPFFKLITNNQILKPI